MFTLPYNPVAVVPWIVGGLLSGLIFKSSARSPISGKGAGLAGHGTMVMLPLASSGWLGRSYLAPPGRLDLAPAGCGFGAVVTA